MREEQAVRDVLPGHPLARHIDDFLTDLANANKPHNTIRAYRGDLLAFAACSDGEVAGLTAAPVRAFLGEIAGQAPARCKVGPGRGTGLAASPFPRTASRTRRASRPRNGLSASPGQGGARSSCRARRPG